MSHDPERLPPSPSPGPDEVVPTTEDATSALTADDRSIAPRTVATPLSPGTIVNGRYSIEALAGAGGMGFVYRARDALASDRLVALKTIRAHVISASALGMFKAEFRTMTSLRHPNIAEVYDFEPVHGGEGGQIISMEYIEGRDIARAAAAAGPDRLLEMLVQMCRALSYLHNRRVIHFDLKPANVLVRDDGVVKVLDFGIAGPARPTRMRGTPLYMAPEALQHAAEIDHRADLYSLGVLAYQLFFGRRPYEGHRVSDLLLRQLLGPPPFEASRVPGWLEAILRKLLALEPAERFRSANEVIEAINEGGGGAYELETRETKESYILSSRFVGRREQCDRVLAFVEARTNPPAPDAARDRPIALFVGGPSGMGKSRLMREVRQHLQLGRVLFIEADCFEGGVSEYAPVVDALRQLLPYVQATGGGSLLASYGSELVKLLPELATRYELRPSPSLDSHEHEQRRLTNALVSCFIGASAFVPYALYVNDLQWARTASAMLVLELARAVAYRQTAGEGVRLALIGSYRSDEVEGRPLGRLLDVLRGTALIREELLQPLSSRDVEELFRSMLGVSELPEAFFSRLCAESGGNPFFLQEFVRVMVDDGSIFLRRGTWTTARQIRELRLPDSIATAFRRRLQGVPAAERAVLDVTALFGRPMPLSLLEHIYGESADDVHMQVASLTNRGLLVASEGLDGLRYGLAHDRMRETIAAELPPTNRCERHRRIGEALEAVHALGLDEVASDLAFHFRLAGVREKARGYSLLAGDKARAIYENGQAIEHFEQALALLDHGATQQRTYIWDALADLHCLTGSYERAEAFVERLAGVITDPLEKARLERRRSEIAFQRGELNQALEAAWQSIRLLGGSRPRTRPGYVLATITTFLRHRVQFRFPMFARPYADPAARVRAAELAESYVRLAYVTFFVSPLTVFYPAFGGLNAAERAGSADRAKHYAGATFQYGVLGRYRTAREFSKRAIADAERFHSTWNLASAHNFRGDVETWAGQLAVALEHNRKARDAFIACGDIFELGNTIYHMLEVYYCWGDFRRIIAEATEYYEVFERTGSVMAGKAILFALGRAYGLTGRLDDAIRLGREAVAWCEKGRDRLLTPAAYLALGESYLALGRRDEAIAQFEAAKAFREHHRVLLYYTAPSYRLLAHAYLDKLCDMPERERTHTQEFRRLPGLLRSATKQARWYPAHEAPTLLVRARNLRLIGKRHAAIAMLDKSIVAAQAFSARFWLAQAHEEMADALRETGSAAAADHAEKARQAFAECGAVRAGAFAVTAASASKPSGTDRVGSA